MADHSLALQKTVFDALDGDSTLQSKVTDIYDFVPQSTAYPYVTIGDDTTTDNATKNLDGNEHTIMVHTWSRYRGRKEVKDIMARIYALLNNSSLTVSGASLVNARFEFADILVDPDGLTKHGVQRFRFVVFDT